MVAIPESTNVSLQQRLTQHAKARWPGLSRIAVRYRAGFAYGLPIDTAQNALDCAGDLYLTDLNP